MQGEGKGESTNLQVFISYARADAAEWAQKLAQILREHGFQPWLDVEHGRCFDHLLLRGYCYASGDWQLACATHDILKCWRSGKAVKH